MRATDADLRAALTPELLQKAIDHADYTTRQAPDETYMHRWRQAVCASLVAALTAEQHVTSTIMSVKPVSDQHHEQCPWAKVDVERTRSVCGCPEGWPKALTARPEAAPMNSLRSPKFDRPLTSEPAPARPSEEGAPPMTFVLWLRQHAEIIERAGLNIQSGSMHARELVALLRQSADLLAARPALPATGTAPDPLESFCQTKDQQGEHMCILPRGHCGPCGWQNDVAATGTGAWQEATRVVDEFGPCEACDGTGQVPSGGMLTLNCSKCGATGRVLKSRIYYRDEPPAPTR